MKIGLVSIWCNRGQATVSRHLRALLDELGHETCIFALPAEGNKQIILSEDVWDQPKVTAASAKRISQEEYLSWAKAEGIELVFCDQNYQFPCIRALRARGITTIGRFVWEAFRDIDVERSQRAYTTIYSITKCEQERYAAFGIQSPRIRWGCHPEIIALSHTSSSTDEIRFFFPASGQRKLVKETLVAFNQFAPQHARLIVKSNERAVTLEIPDELISDRIEWIKDDLNLQDFHKLISSCHVCIAPSKWEGLGLHLYEAIAHGLPIISIDIPPINEIVINQQTGILVPGTKITESRSGIPGYTCHVEDLGQAISTLSDYTTYKQFHEQVLEQRSRMDWKYTIEDVQELISTSHQR
jgi:1,2-diacylglycerol 3-alpha-glucosyltransferase